MNDAERNKLIATIDGLPKHARDGYFLVDVPDYCTDVGAAMRALEKWCSPENKNCQWVVLKGWADDEESTIEYTCRIYFGRGDEVADAPTPARAISLALVEAVK